MVRQGRSHRCASHRADPSMTCCRYPNIDPPSCTTSTCRERAGLVVSPSELLFHLCDIWAVGPLRFYVFFLGVEHYRQCVM